MEKRIGGKTWPGHFTSWSKMELHIDEPQKSSLPVRQWMISAHQPSLRSKVDRFSEIVASPVKCLETHDDVPPPNTDFVFRNTTLYSVRDDFNSNNNNTSKSSDLEIERSRKSSDSTSSQTKTFEKHTKTDSENGIIPQSLGRQDFQAYEPVTLCSEDEKTELAVQRLQNCISNAGLRFNSEPVESLNVISSPDFPSAGHGSSFVPNFPSPDLSSHTRVSPSSTCNFHPFSSDGTPYLSAEVLGFCTLKDRKAEGLTEMCTVQSLLHDREEKDLGKVRNLEDEDLKDLSIQTNTEEGKKMPADFANGAPLPDWPLITPIDSSCHASYPASAEGVEECRKGEDRKAGLCSISVMPREASQTQHGALHSGSSYMKGVHPQKAEERGAGIISARQCRQKAKAEMKTIKLTEGAKEKKDKEKMGNERIRGLTVTRAMARERAPTAIPELLNKVPHGNSDSRGKAPRKSPNKATGMSSRHGFVSETESRRKGEKDRKSPLAAPVMGNNTENTETPINKSVLDRTSYSDHSYLMRSDDKTEVTLDTYVNRSQTRRSKISNISYRLSRSVNARSSRMGKALSAAQFESAAAVDGGMCSSKHSMTQSAKTTGCIEKKDKDGEISNLFGAHKLPKRPELGVQSRGRQFCPNTKRMEILSEGSPQCSDVQVAQSEMTVECVRNERSGQGNGLHGERTQQKGNDDNGVVKDAEEEGSHHDTDRVEVVKEDEEGIVCSRDFQRESAPGQETKKAVKNYLKGTCKLRPVSVQGEERGGRNTSSKSSLVSLKRQVQLQSTVNKLSNVHLGSDVGCNDLKGNTTQECPQISLPVQAETTPLIPDHRPGTPVSMHNDKEANEGGGATPILAIPSMDNSPKSKKRKSSRKEGICQRNRHSRGRKDAPMVVKGLQRNDNLVKILRSSSPQSSLKRRHSCPDMNHPHSPRAALMLASSPLGRLPCSAVYHVSHAPPRPSAVKRARRHTVSSLEVEREIVPLCLRKEVYPVGWGNAPRLCPNFTSSPKTLASCFLASPLAFLSSMRQNGCGKIGSSCGNGDKGTSFSSCSFATPTPSCPATSSVCHPLFPATTSSVPAIHQSSASVFSFCSVPSLRDEQKLKPDDAEENGRFRLELDVQERCEAKSLSDSEIKVERMKQRERGKVSQIKIRKTLPKPATNLTPMGLPKPVRLKKKEFSLEEIYTNKNFHEPPDGRLETIFEVPISGRDGSVSVAGQRRIKRFVEFPEVGMPRKPRRPVIRSGASRKAVECSNLARTRRGGNDRTKEGCILTLQEIEAILCSKLEQLDTWIALDEDGLSSNQTSSGSCFFNS